MSCIKALENQAPGTMYGYVRQERQQHLRTRPTDDNSAHPATSPQGLHTKCSPTHLAPESRICYAA